MYGLRSRYRVHTLLTLYPKAHVRTNQLLSIIVCVCVCAFFFFPRLA